MSVNAMNGATGADVGATPTAGEQQGGAGEGQKASDQQGDKGGAGVDPSEKKALIDEVMKHKNAARAAAAELERIKTEQMKGQQQWKELAELREKQAQEASERYESLVKSIEERSKFQAVREAALKAGIRKEALSDLEMIELKGVVVERTTTGRENVLGADSVIERLKAQRPHWFENKTPPNVNTGKVGVVDTGGQITPQMLLAAEKEASKTGDMSSVKRLYQQYQLQQQQR